MSSKYIYYALAFIFILTCHIEGAEAQVFSFKRKRKAEMALLEKYPNSKEGLTELLATLLKADKKTRSALTQALKPEAADYASVFLTPDLQQKVAKYHERLYHSIIFSIQPNLPEQNHILLWQATAIELKNYTGDAVYFPGGYKEMATLLHPELTYYRCKFVEAGKSTGSAYELLVHVNGKWRFFPRPWVVLMK